MITPDGFLDWAIRMPGPPDKTNGGVSPVTGFVAHSAEGYEPAIMGVLNDPSRRASWHFTNLYDGRLWQHYSIFAQCWASGAAMPNNNWPAMEHEGIAGEALTEAQVATTTRVIRDLSALKGWPPKRPVSSADISARLWEHREMVRFGADATACPSGRIPWTEILRRLDEQEDDDMWIRHNRTADWFTGRDMAAGGYMMQTASDFGLPPGAELVRFGVDMAAGHVRWFDGNEVSVAGASSPRYSTVELLLNGKTQAPFIVEEAAHFNVIECLGYSIGGK